MIGVPSVSLLAVSSEPSEELTLGLVLVILAPFVGMYVFVKLSRFYRSRQREVVGPHVVYPVFESSRGQPYTLYKCKYCKKERERKGFFLDEDCEEFEA